jgi:hypothetical protein
LKEKLRQNQLKSLLHQFNDLALSTQISKEGSLTLIQPVLISAKLQKITTIPSHRSKQSLQAEKLILKTKATPKSYYAVIEPMEFLVILLMALGLSRKCQMAKLENHL